MTTKTATKPTTRIEQLAETIAAHRANVAEIESKATMFEAEGAACDQRIESMVSNFERPAEGMPEDLRALKATAQSYRDAAELLRKRATAYSTANELPSLESEHRALVAAETERVNKDAAVARHAGLVAEWEGRSAQLKRHYLAGEALTWRINFLADEIAALSQRHGLSQSPRLAFVVADIDKEVRWKITHANNTAQKDEIMAHLPKLDS